MLIFHKLSLYISKIYYGNRFEPKYTISNSNHAFINKLNLTSYILFVDNTLYIDCYNGPKNIFLVIKYINKSYQLIIEWYENNRYKSITLEGYTRYIEALYNRFV